MKMTRRISIALLIVAVMVSTFAVFASAAEHTIDDYANVLEYFEEQTLIDYDFSKDANYSDIYLPNANRVSRIDDKIVADDLSPLGKYLSIGVKESSGFTGRNTDFHAYLNWTSADAIDDFNIDMIVSGSVYETAANTSDEKLPRIIVVVNDSEFGTAEASTDGVPAGTTIAAIDFRGGVFSYLKAMDKDGTVYGAEVKTEYVLSADAWYNVSLTYDADKGVSITVTNCANAADTITVTDGYVPVSSVKNVRVGMNGNDGAYSRGSMMKFASYRLLSGVYHRDMANMQTDVEEKLLAMYTLFANENTDVESKIKVCDIVKKIRDYGFTTENADVQKALDELGVGALGLYNAKIEEFVATVDALETFAQKRAYAVEIGSMADALADIDLTGAPEDMKAATAKNLADFKAVVDKLDAKEAETLKFIALADGANDIDFNDYVVVKATLASFDNVSPDLTYEGVDEANKIYTRLFNSENDIRESAEKFISAVNTANNTELEFNVRVDAYRQIETLYFDNTTYSGVAEAIVTYNDVLLPYMQLEISNAENFIKYVNKADYASYISAKQENLNIAKTYMDICQPIFAGVAEAKALYAEIEAYIAEQVANVTAYINAVNALDNLTGAALTEGINTAMKLQSAGNVLGVDGVTEANIKLEQIVAAIELSERYCVHFLSLANALDTAKNASETFDILVEAKSIEANTDKNYAGITEAMAKFADAIAAYNAQVNAINAEFEEANDVAANSCGLGGNNVPVSMNIVALIKKFFED